MKVCPNCNTETEDNALFCPSCGAPMRSANDIVYTAPDNNTDASGTGSCNTADSPYSYQSCQQTQTPVNTAWGGNPVYPVPNMNEPETAPVLKTSEWVWTIFLTCIPVANLIVLIIWAASDDANPNKRNWARANLIIVLIEIAIAIGFVILAGVLAAVYGGA